MKAYSYKNLTIEKSVEAIETSSGDTAILGGPEGEAILIALAKKHGIGIKNNKLMMNGRLIVYIPIDKHVFGIRALKRYGTVLHNGQNKELSIVTLNSVTSN